MRMYMPAPAVLCSGSYMYLPVPVHVRMYVRTYMCVRTYVRICLRICMHVFFVGRGVDIRTYVHEQRRRLSLLQKQHPLAQKKRAKVAKVSIVP